MVISLFSLVISQHIEHTMCFLPEEANPKSHPVIVSSSKPRIPEWWCSAFHQISWCDCSKFGDLCTKKTHCLPTTQTRYLVAEQEQGNHNKNSKSVKGNMGGVQHVYYLSKDCEESMRNFLIHCSPWSLTVFLGGSLFHGHSWSRQLVWSSWELPQVISKNIWSWRWFNVLTVRFFPA